MGRADRVRARADQGARSSPELIGPFLLRRRKSDPGIAPELPPKTETDHLLGLTREQVVLYEAFVRDTMDRIERADEAHPPRPGARAADRPQADLQPPGPVPQAVGRDPARRPLGEARRCSTSCVGTVVAEDGAVLVFTQYVAMARLLERAPRAGRRAPPVPPRRHPGRASARRWWRGSRPGEVPVFLLVLKAGGTGLNLTRADHVIHVDRWWNPAVEEQATDRAHRIGQTKPVQVHRMVTRGTIEERVAGAARPQARARGRRARSRRSRPHRAQQRGAARPGDPAQGSRREAYLTDLEQEE